MLKDGSMIALRQLLTPILCFVLAHSKPALVYADTASDQATKIINLSHQASRDIAEDLYRFYLLNGLNDSFNNNKILHRVVEAVTALQTSSSALLLESKDLAFQIEDVIAKIEGEESSLHQINMEIGKASKAYTDLLTEIQLNSYKVNSAEATARNAAKSVKAILAHFQQSCEQGVSAQFTIPNLPPVTISPPDFTIGFEFKVSGDSSYSQTDMSIAPVGSTGLSSLFGDSDDAGAYAAATTTLAQIGAYKLALAYGFKGAAAWAAAGVVVLIVMIIVFLVMDAHQKSKAKKQANAVEDSIRKKANASHVAEHYKKICETSGTPLLELYKKLEANESIGAPSEDDIVYVQDVLGKMSQMDQAIDEATANLRNQGLSGDALEKAVVKSKEYTSRMDYIRNQVGFDGFVKAVRIQLQALTDQSGQALTIIEKIKTSDNTELEASQQLKATRTRLEKVYSLSYAQSLLAQNPEAVETLKAEVKTDAKVSKLYVRWYQAYSSYLFASLNNFETTDAKSLLLGVEKDLLTALSENPTSKTLLLIKTRLTAFLKGI